MSTPFFDLYFKYTEHTECPRIFHRWCAIAGIGAILGRNYYFNHGNFTVNPNLYVMLMGEPGTRKSTAILGLKNILQRMGYDTIAADKTTKEKFLVDLSLYMKGDESEAEQDILDKNLWGTETKDMESKAPSECFIMADEFNDFAGDGNMEFYSILGRMWDYFGVYRSRIKNGKSISISNPTVNILGGNTAIGFNRAFPPEIIGQGFFSRLILVHAISTGKKLTFPEPVPVEVKKSLDEFLVALKTIVVGPAQKSALASSLLDTVYKSWPGMDDPRFKSYGNRRFTQLLKLCLICSAMRLSTTIEEEDVLLSNTILTHAESQMPKALGEFGKSRNASVANKIMQVLSSTSKPLTYIELYTVVSTDLDKAADLGEILKNLAAAGKIMPVRMDNTSGFISKISISVDWSSQLLDINLLTEEERI